MYNYCVSLCACVHRCSSYSYCIDGSLDEKDWVRLIDHTHYLCRSWQNLRFPARVVRSVRQVRLTEGGCGSLAVAEIGHCPPPYIVVI